MVTDVADVGAMIHMQLALSGYDAGPEPSVTVPVAAVKTVHVDAHPVHVRLCCHMCRETCQWS